MCIKTSLKGLNLKSQILYLSSFVGVSNIPA